MAVPSGSENEGTIYFERQARFLCGVHALNNLLGKAEFTVGEMDAFAKTAGTSSVFGYYDANALQLAADDRGYVIDFYDSRKSLNEMKLDDNSLVGILLNISSTVLYLFKSRHWLGIRKVVNEENGGVKWYLVDSKEKKPQLLELDQLLPTLSRLRESGAQVLLLKRKENAEETEISSPNANEGCEGEIKEAKNS